MSSPDAPRRARLTAALALCVGLAGCFQPLYGPTASGEGLRDQLAAIEIAEVGVAPNFERVAHYLRSELAFDLNGSGMPAPKRYKLALSFASTLSTPIVDTQSGRAQSATINGTVTYSLTNADGSKTLASGKAPALELLIFAVRAAVFLAAQRARNVMDDGGQLQRLACVFRQSLARADGLRVGMHLQKVVDVMLVSV